MRFLDQLIFNWQLFKGHKIRTLLLQLAVSIGVASVILLTSLAGGAREFINNEFSSLGNQILIVIPGRKETTGGAPPMYGTVSRDLTLDDAMAFETVRGVEAIAPVIAGTALVSNGALSRETITLGSTAAIFQVRNLEVAQGIKLPLRSDTTAMAVCVIGAKLKRELFGNQRAVGEWVRIDDRRMRVIGVLADRGESLGMDLRDMVLIPVLTAQQLFNSPGLFRVLIEMDELIDVEGLKQGILDVVKQRHDGEDDVTLITQDAMMDAFGNIIDTLGLALFAIAAISLVVSGILIMNISLVSVSQRRQEIGLLKAIGASQGHIRQLFLGESLLLVFSGSVIGVLVAYFAIYVFAQIWPNFPLVPPMWSVPAAVLTAFAAGLIFSWLPAKRAAALDPVLAMRGIG